MRPNRLVLGLLATAALTACGASPDASGTDESAFTAPISVTQQPAATDAPVPDPSPESTAASTDPTMIPDTEATMTTDSSSPIPITTDELQAAAIADLAGRLSVDRSTITVTRHEEVEWSDGSLGCPQPGFNYTQAITPGYLIVLTVDGQDYEYHGRPGSSPFYCATPRPPAVGGVGGP